MYDLLVNTRHHRDNIRCIHEMKHQPFCNSFILIPNIIEKIESKHLLGNCYRIPDSIDMKRNKKGITSCNMYSYLIKIIGKIFFAVFLGLNILLLAMYFVQTVIEIIVCYFQNLKFLNIRLYYLKQYFYLRFSRTISHNILVGLSTQKNRQNFSKRLGSAKVSNWIPSLRSHYQFQVNRSLSSSST